MSHQAVSNERAHNTDPVPSRQSDLERKDQFIELIVGIYPIVLYIGGSN
jgi:hypothetical protein